MREDEVIEFSDEFKSLVWDMLKFDSKKRITAKQAHDRAREYGWHLKGFDKLQVMMTPRLEEF